MLLKILDLWRPNGVLKRTLVYCMPFITRVLGDGGGMIFVRFNSARLAARAANRIILNPVYPTPYSLRPDEHAAARCIDRKLGRIDEPPYPELDKNIRDFYSHRRIQERSAWQS